MDVIVDIDDLSNVSSDRSMLLASLDHKLQSMLFRVQNDDSSSIYRVSTLMRNSQLYEPRIISIGPYNHGRHNCEAMEEYKWRFFSDFLSRDSNVCLDHYTNLIQTLEVSARRCYNSSIIAEISSDDFVQMLLIDGCFILEILLKWDHGDFISLANVSSRMSYIRSDLLLLENQLPFFVLQKLLKLLFGDHIQSPCDSAKKNVNDYLMDIIYGFFNENNERNITYAASLEFEGEINHMLHLLYKWSVPNLKETVPTGPELRLFPRFRGSRLKERRPTIPNAMWLALTGVKFKSTKPSGSFFNVVFDKGVMKMPTFKIDSEGMSRLANLMVFEQSMGLQEHKVASYVLLMDSLIDTADDVELLKVCGVVQNTLESNYDAAAFFNQLGEHCRVDLKNHYYAPMFGEILDFYESKWNRNKASLRLKYFNSPWAAISVIGATALMILTGLQTYYTILGYYPH